MDGIWNISNRSYVSEEATVITVFFQTELADNGAQSEATPENTCCESTAL
jgi:hypothetical protein